MSFWKKRSDPEVESARAEAEVVLPPGWAINRSDLETFTLPRGRVETYGICASGPQGEKALVVAVGEANAYRQFRLFMLGDLEVAQGWAVPLPPQYDKPRDRTFDVRHEDDPDVVAAKADLDAAVPPGWKPFDTDRERYFFPDGYLETWAVSAAGPDGQVELVLGVGEAGAFRQLARRLRGELDVQEAWAAPMEEFRSR